METYVLGLALFAWAASDFDAGSMEASSNITIDSRFQPVLALHWPFPSSPRPTWPLQVSLLTLLNKSCSNKKILELLFLKLLKLE